MTNVLAARYAPAAYIQLFALSTPFFVTLMSRLFFKEPIPHAFFLCLVVSVVGSLLLLIDDFQQFAFVSLDGDDVLGLVMSIVTAFCLACYMISTKFATMYKAPASQALLMQGLCSAVAAVLLSIFIDTDWNSLQTAQWWEWLVVFGIAIIFYSGNMINVRVIAKAGATFNSFFIGLRLLVAILAAWLILGESLEKFWQWIGVFVVLVATTTFLVLQERAKERQRLLQAQAAIPLEQPALVEDDDQSRGGGAEREKGVEDGEELSPLTLAAPEDGEGVDLANDDEEGGKFPRTAFTFGKANAGAGGYKPLTDVEAV